MTVVCGWAVIQEVYQWLLPFLEFIAPNSWIYRSSLTLALETYPHGHLSPIPGLLSPISSSLHLPQCPPFYSPQPPKQLSFVLFHMLPICKKSKQPGYQGSAGKGEERISLSL